MVGNARAERSAECGNKSPYSGCNVILFWFTHGRGWPTPRFVTFKQAQEAGGSVRKGEHGTKVYFVKQLRITEGEGEAEAEHLVPMMREYTVFNVAQCEGLPASIIEGKPARVRNPDARDALADDFLGSIGADIREGHGEAYYAPGQDFISLPAFAAFRGADHFYNVAFHELTHWTGHKARLDRDLKGRFGKRPMRPRNSLPSSAPRSSPPNSRLMAMCGMRAISRLG